MENCTTFVLLPSEKHSHMEIFFCIPLSTESLLHKRALNVVFHGKGISLHFQTNGAEYRSIHFKKLSRGRWSPTSFTQKHLIYQAHNKKKKNYKYKKAASSSPIAAEIIVLLPFMLFELLRKSVWNSVRQSKVSFGVFGLWEKDEEIGR